MSDVCLHCRHRMSTVIIITISLCFLSNLSQCAPSLSWYGYDQNMVKALAANRSCDKYLETTKALVFDDNDSNKYRLWPGNNEHTHHWLLRDSIQVHCMVGTYTEKQKKAEIIYRVYDHRSVYTEKAQCIYRVAHSICLFLFKTEIGLSTPEDAERGELLFGFREATEVTD